MPNRLSQLLVQQVAWRALCSGVRAAHITARRLLPGRVKRWIRALLHWSSWMEERYVRPMILSFRVRHVAGPKAVHYGPNEVIAVCVVRNGASHIRAFIEHHLNLGVRHIVFLDNGSTDNTIALARAYSNVTILRTDCPYRKYETLMKHYLVRRFSQGRWNLCLDIDELFDYPFSDVLSLASLIAYLNHNGYTAVVAQMLDMFPDARLSDLQSISSDYLSEAYPYYDISNIRKEDYPWETLSNAAIKLHRGGIRKTLFGTHNGLTKVPLVFVDESIELFVSWHHVRNARIADFTCVLLHYPFVNSFRSKVLEAVETNRYGNTTAAGEYKKYEEALHQNPDRRMKEKMAHKLMDVNSLIGDGFLVVSPAYLQWVTDHSNDNRVHLLETRIEDV